jgi:hypothetical protein
MRHFKLIYGFVVITLACWIIRPIESVWCGIRFFGIGLKEGWIDSCHESGKYYKAVIKTWRGESSE